MDIHIMIVTLIEERDFEAGLGEAYRVYRRRVRAVQPLCKA